MLQNLPSKTRGRRKYPAAMCPKCKHLDTNCKTAKLMQYVCNQCKISFKVHPDGSSSYNEKIAEGVRRNNNDTIAEKKLELALIGLLQGGTIPTRDFAKRPSCGTCGKPVTGRSFYHRSTGDKYEVTCGMCVRGTETRKLFQ